VRLIDEKRFQGEVREVIRPKFRVRKQYHWEKHRLSLLKLGYASTVVLIILLIYLGFVQKP
jgi:hypothetical protein